MEKYTKKRNYLNHEWIYDVDVKEIIESVKTILEFMDIDYTEEKDLEEYNTQIQ